MCTSICIIWKSMIKSMIELQNLTIETFKVFDGMEEG